MSEPRDVLRDILDRHGRILLEDSRRCEACIRDTRLSKREIAMLLGALETGIARRIAALTDAQPAAVGTARLAVQLAEDSGLSDDAARWSVATWAYALRIALDGESTPRQPDGTLGDAELPQRPDIEARHGDEGESVRSPAPAERRPRYVGILLLLQGFAYLLGQSGRNILLSLLFYGVGSACAWVGLMVLRGRVRSRAAGIGLCVLLLSLGALLIYAGEAASQARGRGVVGLSGMVVALVGIIPLLRWRPATAAPATDSSAAGQGAATMLLFAGLCGFWALGGSMGGFIFAADRVWLFDDGQGWLWLKAPIDAVLVLIAGHGLGGRLRREAAAVAAVLCLVAAGMAVAYLASLPNGRATPVELILLPAVLDVVAAGLLLRARRRSAQPAAAPAAEVAQGTRP